LEAGRDSTSDDQDGGLSVMHEQRQEDDDRQRDADQPEKSAFPKPISISCVN
jgi:hypothetical protein